MGRRNQSPTETFMEMCGEIFTLIHPLWSIPTATVVSSGMVGTAKTDPRSPDMTVVKALGMILSFSVLAGGDICWIKQGIRAESARANLDLDWAHVHTWREFDEGFAAAKETRWRSSGATARLVM